MNRALLQTVLRSTAGQPPATDGALLERFAATRDEEAFAGLVERHGRLVWVVCRHLTHCDADADDAFQATFLVLMRNAGKVRDGARLSAWLHGAAYRVCAKARLAAKRRTRRESAAAKPDRSGSTVPDSAWDRALAAVHEEVARLPEPLRVPFILCCLEGMGTSEAARQLGWKLGTFSARLTRAKDAVAARLEKRGIALGLAAAASLTTVARVPAAVVDRAVSWLHDGVVVPRSIFTLTQGVLAMKVSPIKLLVAMVLLACGLGFGGGSRNTADAQQPPEPFIPDRNPLDPALDAAWREQNRLLGGERPDGAVASTKKWDYDFVLLSDLTTRKFVEFLQDRESRGWEFNGQSTLLHDGKPAGVWVFRRPVQGSSNPPSVDKAPSNNKTPSVKESVLGETGRIPAPSAGGEKDTTLMAHNVPLKLETLKEVASLFDMLEAGAARKFGAGQLKLTYDPRGSGSIHLEGSNAATGWAIETIEKLQQKKPQVK